MQPSNLCVSESLFAKLVPLQSVRRIVITSPTSALPPEGIKCGDNCQRSVFGNRLPDTSIKRDDIQNVQYRFQYQFVFRAWIYDYSPFVAFISSFLSLPNFSSLLESHCAENAFVAILCSLHLAVPYRQFFALSCIEAPRPLPVLPSHNLHLIFLLSAIPKTLCQPMDGDKLRSKISSS